MWTRSQFAKFIIAHERRLIEALAEGFRSDEPEPEPDEPPPPKRPQYAPGSQAWFRSLPAPRRDGVDMNSLRRAADRERKSKRLPRSPEEALGYRYWR
jgi:hypothetical protein